MKQKIMLCSLLSLVLAGCASLQQPLAVVNDGRIENPALGFFGFTYDIPEGFDLYNSALMPVAECTDLQKLAIRIYDLNNAYHPSGNESYYESFLMFSENTAFLLITVKHDWAGGNLSWTEDGLDASRQLMPLYNVSDSQHVSLGDSRLAAVLTSGTAYEKKGWHYSQRKSGRVPFRYKACKASGSNRDSYILMGFSLPEYENVLSLHMQEMVNGFNF